MSLRSQLSSKLAVTHFVVRLVLFAVLAIGAILVIIPAAIFPKIQRPKVMGFKTFVAGIDPRKELGCRILATEMEKARLHPKTEEAKAGDANNAADLQFLAHPEDRDASDCEARLLRMAETHLRIRRVPVGPPDGLSMGFTCGPKAKRQFYLKKEIALTSQGPTRTKGELVFKQGTKYYRYEKVNAPTGGDLFCLMPEKNPLVKVIKETMRERIDKTWAEAMKKVAKAKEDTIKRFQPLIDKHGHSGCDQADFWSHLAYSLYSGLVALNLLIGGLAAYFDKRRFYVLFLVFTSFNVLIFLPVGIFVSLPNDSLPVLPTYIQKADSAIAAKIKEAESSEYSAYIGVGVAMLLKHLSAFEGVSPAFASTMQVIHWVLDRGLQPLRFAGTWWIVLSLVQVVAIGITAYLVHSIRKGSNTKALDFGDSDEKVPLTWDPEQDAAEDGDREVHGWEAFGAPPASGGPAYPSAASAVSAVTQVHGWQAFGAPPASGGSRI